MVAAGFGDNVAVEDERDASLDLAFLHELAVAVIRAEGFPADTELTVAMVSDSRISDMNSEYLGKSGPTDVLSFPIHDLEPGAPPEPPTGSPPLTLGDVLIAPAYVFAQARDLEVGFNGEMALMVVHGILHLMGYDHEDDADAEIMESRETVLLASMGVERR